MVVQVVRMRRWVMAAQVLGRVPLRRGSSTIPDPASWSVDQAVGRFRSDGGLSTKQPLHLGHG